MITSRARRGQVLGCRAVERALMRQAPACRQIFSGKPFRLERRVPWHCAKKTCINGLKEQALTTRIDKRSVTEMTLLL